MNKKIKGANNSYFHNSLLMARQEDRKSGIGIIDASSDDVICRLNGYAVIPIEEYYNLKGEEIPEGTTEKIKEMNERLVEI